MNKKVIIISLIIIAAAVGIYFLSKKKDTSALQKKITDTWPTQPWDKVFPNLTSADWDKFTSLMKSGFGTNGVPVDGTLTPWFAGIAKKFGLFPGAWS